MVVPCSSTIKYMVGLFSKTSRHCCSLSRKASSVRLRLSRSAVGPSALAWCSLDARIVTTPDAVKKSND